MGLIDFSEVQPEDEQERAARLAAIAPVTGGPAATGTLPGPTAALKPAIATPGEQKPAVSLPPVGGKLPGSEPLERDQAELKRLQDTGSGVSQVQKKHPILGGLLRGIDTVGSILSPGISMMIPGTTLHHKALEAGAGRAINQDIANQATQVESDVKAHPPAKEGLTPEEQTIHDLMTGDNGMPRVNPETGQPYTYLDAYTAVTNAKQEAKPEKEDQKLLRETGTAPEAVNAGFLRRWQVLHPGEQIPKDLQVGPDAKVADEKRIDAALKAEESVQNIALSRNATNQQRTFENTRQAENDRERREHQQEIEAEKKQKDRDTYVAPHQDAIDKYELQKAYVDGGKPTGTGDYEMMLQFQEMITAGAKAGIRFNQAEQARIEHARSLLGGIGAQARHLVAGTYFSDTQRHEILDAMKTMADAHQRAVERFDREHGGAKETKATTSGGNVPANTIVYDPTGKPHRADGTAPLPKGWSLDKPKS